MTAAVLPQFVLLPSELLRCVFLLIADFGKYQVNRLKRIHFSSLDCQDFSPRAHPSPGRQREKESSCPSPKKQSRNPCGAPGLQLALSADVLEETPEAWLLERSPMASQLLWGAWVRVAAEMDVLGTAIPALFHISEPSWRQFLTRLSTVASSPVPVWKRDGLSLLSRRWAMGLGWFWEHQTPAWCGRCEQGVLVTG